MKKFISMVVVAILIASTVSCVALAEGTQKGINIHEYVINYFCHLRTIYSLTDTKFDYKNTLNCMCAYHQDNFYMIDGSVVTANEDGTVSTIAWTPGDDNTYSLLQLIALYSSIENKAMGDPLSPTWATDTDFLKKVLSLEEGQTIEIGDYVMNPTYIGEERGFMILLK